MATRTMTTASIALTPLPSRPSPSSASSPANSRPSTPPPNPRPSSSRFSPTSIPAPINAASTVSTSTTLVSTATSSPPSSQSQSQTCTNERKSSSWTTKLTNAAITLVGLVAAYIAISQGYASLSQGEAGLALARWTARKDYLEECRAENVTLGHLTRQCRAALATPLEPPPGFAIHRRALRHVRRGLNLASSYAESVADILILAWLVALGVVAGLYLIRLGFQSIPVLTHYVANDQTAADTSNTQANTAEDCSAWVPTSWARLDTGVLRLRKTGSHDSFSSDGKEEIEWPTHSPEGAVKIDRSSQMFVPSKTASQEAFLERINPLKLKCEELLAVCKNDEVRKDEPSTRIYIQRLCNSLERISQVVINDGIDWTTEPLGILSSLDLEIDLLRQRLVPSNIEFKDAQDEYIQIKDARDEKSEEIVDDSGESIVSERTGDTSEIKHTTAEMTVAMPTRPIEAPNPAPFFPIKDNGMASGSGLRNANLMAVFGDGHSSIIPSTAIMWEPTISDSYIDAPSSDSDKQRVVPKQEFTGRQEVTGLSKAFARARDRFSFKQLKLRSKID